MNYITNNVEFQLRKVTKNLFDFLYSGKSSDYCRKTAQN